MNLQIPNIRVIIHCIERFVEMWIRKLKNLQIWRSIDIRFTDWRISKNKNLKKHEFVDSVIYRNTDFENPRAYEKYVGLRIYAKCPIRSMDSKDLRGSIQYIYMYVRVYIYNWSIALNWDVHAMCREPAHRPKYCTVLRNITRHRHLLLLTKSFSRFRAYWSRFINYAYCSIGFYSWRYAFN